MNRGDKIRAKDNYRLADFLVDIMDHCSAASHFGECSEECPMFDCCHNDRFDNVEDWLDEEIEE